MGASRTMTEMSPRRRRLALLAPLLVLLVVAAAWALAFARLYETRRWVAHTHQVIETTESVQGDLSAAESAQRGYLLTGKADYAAIYAHAVAGLLRDTSRLRSLTEDNPAQQRRLDALALEVGERTRLLERGFSLKSQGVDSAASVARLEQGRRVMDRVRATALRIETEEQALLDERVATEQRRLIALAVLFPVGLALVALVALWINGALVAYAEGQRESRQQIELQNEELQQQGVELELQAENLEHQAAELEVLNEELGERTQAAEMAQREAEHEREAVRELSAQLQARVAELETVFERLPVGLCIAHDPECRSIRVNPTFARLLRVRPDENISSSRPDAEIALPYTVWHEGRPIAPDEQPMQVAARTGSAVDGVDLDLRFADGEVLHLYGWAAPLFDEAGRVRGALAGYLDVTQREESALQIRHMAERFEKLYGLAAELSRAATPEEVAAVACDWGRRVLGATAAVFCVLSPDGSALEPLHMVGAGPEFAARWRRVPLDVPAAMTEALRGDRTVSVSCAADRDRLFPALGAPAGLEAALAGALRLEDRVLGAWAVHFDFVRTFSAEEVHLFDSVTVQCAQALERTRLLESERHARGAAEAANEAKLKFLRVMSHDLRTPLNAILGYTELLQESVPGPLNDTQVTYLGRVRASTGVLRTLIDEILEFARIEAGHVEIRIAAVPVSRLLDNVEAVVGAQIRAKEIHLRRGPVHPRLAVLADADRARQVLMNLVANALKFTAPGGEIAFECEADPTRVRISVRDTGVGIPAGELERIFEPFVQAHRPEELGTEQGVGLGLAISRELARAMNGEVTAMGAVGKGSVFTLELPRAHLPVPAQAAADLAV